MMFKKLDLKILKELYENGENLIQYMSNDDQFKSLSLQEKVFLSYDIQAGAYIKSYPNYENLKIEAAQKISSIINQLDVETVLDAGTGEATTLADIIRFLRTSPSISFAAFDISLSRLLYARQFLKKKEVVSLVQNLFTSDLTQISLANGSVDLTMTFHALEPNGGKEQEIIKELHRITRKYLLLIEPSWEFGSSEQKKRMETHGYIKSLPETVVSNGFEILNYEPWGLDANPLNRACLIVARKSTAGNCSKDFQYSVPGTNQKLIKVDDGFYSKDTGFLFPKIANVDCLLDWQAIPISRYLEATNPQLSD